MDRLKKKSIEIGTVIDRSFIDEVGFSEELSNLLRRELKDANGNNCFVSNEWEKALETREPVYYELVIEFLSTFHFNEHMCRSGDLMRSRCIRFPLAGVWFETTLIKFGVMLGLYTKPQTLWEYLPEYFMSGALEPDEDFQCATFWASIGKGPYVKSNTKASSIIRPEHRLLHRMLAGSLTLRRSVKEKVPEGDMWLLSRLIDRYALTNLPFVFTKMFTETTEPRDLARSGLCGGQYITVIANKRGLLTQEIKSTLTEVTPMRTLDKNLLRTMRVVVPGLRKGAYVWAWESVDQGREDFGTPQSQSSQAESSQRRPGIHSICKALDGISAQITENANDNDEQFNRLTYDLHSVWRELSLVTSTMAGYFESVGYTPTVPFKPYPNWPYDEPAPSGYASYDNWSLDNLL